MAAVGDTAEAVSVRGPKPKAVLALQVLAGLAAFSLGFGALAVAYFFITRLNAQPAASRFLFGGAWRAIACVVLVATIWQIEKRTAIGRIGGLTLLAVAAVPTASALRYPELAGGNSLGHRIGWFGAIFVFLMLHAGWFYFFGFSRRARRYFTARSVDALR